MNTHPTPSLKAPWKDDFHSHLEKQPEFYLATVTPEGLPRVRACIHRGFWAELPPNEHNKLEKNPPIFETDCPVFTTDSRMSKTYELFATGKGHGTVEQSQSGSGGGGPVEAVYWIKDTMTQWRVRGKCWLVAANDVEGESSHNSGTMTVKAEVGRFMRPVGEHEEKNNDWSWRREVDNHFENLSPTMRGTFKNPPPGKPLAQGADSDGEALGQKAGHLEEEELARKNFRVCIIAPEEVERVDLSDPNKSQRWLWTLSQEAGGPGKNDPSHSKTEGEWNMVETWP